MCIHILYINWQCLKKCKVVPALHHPPTSRMVLAHVLGFTLSTALLVQVERLGIFHLGSSKKCGHVGVNMPIGSMYAIYGNIYHRYTPNVSIYTIDGSYGMGQPLWFDGFFAECQEPKNVVFTSGSEEGKWRSCRSWRVKRSIVPYCAYWISC